MGEMRTLDPEIRTERLLLRRWRESDRAPFAQMNGDSRVMEFFPATCTREESDAFAERIENHFQQRGFGLWAVELPNVASFIGFIGLSVPRFDAHFTPCVEIGWRLAFPYWNHGFATEGAHAAVQFGFEQLGLSEIVSLTAEINVRSQRVMQKLGMRRRVEDDFDHPLLPPAHPLTRHVLYRVRPEFGPKSAIG